MIKRAGEEGKKRTKQNITRRRGARRRLYLIETPNCKNKIYGNIYICMYFLNRNKTIYIYIYILKQTNEKLDCELH